MFWNFSQLWFHCKQKFSGKSESPETIAQSHVQTKARRLGACGAWAAKLLNKAMKASKAFTVDWTYIPDQGTATTKMSRTIHRRSECILFSASEQISVSVSDFCRGIYSCNISWIFPLPSCSESKNSSPQNRWTFYMCAIGPGKYLFLVRWAKLTNVVYPAGGEKIGWDTISWCIIILLGRIFCHCLFWQDVWVAIIDNSSLTSDFQ